MMDVVTLHHVRPSIPIIYFVRQSSKTPQQEIYKVQLIGAICSEKYMYELSVIVS